MEVDADQYDNDSPAGTVIIEDSGVYSGKVKPATTPRPPIEIPVTNRKYTCFWCNKRFVDLEKHTKNMHTKLTARSYDFNELLNNDFINMNEIKVKVTKDAIVIYSDPYEAELGASYHGDKNNG
jgi:hypothetical protein